MKKFFIIFLFVAAIGLLSLFYIKNRITISVIIPVYNAERYLPRCLDSIFAQKGIFEVIAVNDGSTDKSAEILEKYARNHSNLKIINQKNAGAAGARNIGIKAAQNKYLTFVDSDDWIEPNTFTLAAEMIKKDKADILLTGYYDVYDREWVKKTRGEEAAAQVAEESKFLNHSLDKLVLFSPFEANESYSDLFYETGGVRARFFSKEFIDKFDVTFGEGLGEDWTFLYKAYLNNPRISILNIPLYNYRNRIDSVSKGNAYINGNNSALLQIQNLEEYKKADRRTQMFIKDSWLILVLIGLANLQRNNALTPSELQKAYTAYKSFSGFNRAELKSCRNFQRLKRVLINTGINLPL